jgi:hypothetical protein
MHDERFYRHRRYRKLDEIKVSVTIFIRDYVYLSVDFRHEFAHVKSVLARCSRRRIASISRIRRSFSVVLPSELNNANMHSICILVAERFTNLPNRGKRGENKESLFIYLLSLSPYFISNLFYSSF